VPSSNSSGARRQIRPLSRRQMAVSPDLSGRNLVGVHHTADRV